MKRSLAMACAAVAVFAMSAGTANAQCYGGGGYGYGGGYRGITYGGYSGYRTSGLSIGYSSFSPRTSFSIGYSSAPRVGFGYSPRVYSPRRQAINYGPTLYRHGNHFHVAPSHRVRGRRW